MLSPPTHPPTQLGSSNWLTLINTWCLPPHTGRDLVGGARWGPRPLDLDIIFYGAQVVQHESLIVPHIRCALCSCGMTHWGEALS